MKVAAGAAAGATAFRDAPCGRIDRAWAGRTARVAGWVHHRRDLGGVVFVTLRDRSGRLQLAFNPDFTPADAMDRVTDLGPEDVLAVSGTVGLRPEGAVNPDMATGEVELRVEAFERLSAADELPILVAVPPEESLPSEELRLRHRVLDLRRPEMMRNFEIRHRATAAARAALDAEGFIELETPLLTRRTPEGARDYLVPSRLHRGEFYALPQSPQLYKQLLMTAGFDRYYQIARCLRDEDLRADRQPEFTQIDAEMAFVAEDDVLGVCERMIVRMWREACGVELERPFLRIPYADALERYGTDKPDLRIGWTIQDFTPVLVGAGFRIVDEVVERGGRVRGFVASGGATLSRSRLAAVDEAARATGVAGALWLKRTEDGWSGPLARYLDAEREARLSSELGVEAGDVVILVADDDIATSRALDALRRSVAAELGAVEDHGGRWVWVTDFPLFEADPDTGRPVPAHHPFTMPVSASAAEIEEDPLSITARAYDLVYNGTEVVSGSIRCHDPGLQRAIFRALGLDAAEIESRFGFLLEAFRYGVPPHGGFAAGLDRLTALMVGAESIRDVIAFPKTTAARGLLEGAPSPIPDADLAELGLGAR